MNLEEIVTRLVGQIQPTGEHNEDQKRLHNLETLTDLVETLLSHILDVAKKSNQQKASIQAIGKAAEQFLSEMTERLRELGFGDS